MQVIKVNDFANFSVRQHFGKYGVDLYFTAAGLPAVLQTDLIYSIAGLWLAGCWLALAGRLTGWLTGWL